MCTIAHTPRLPEHCIEYVRVLLWPKEMPFKGWFRFFYHLRSNCKLKKSCLIELDAPVDGDNPNHIQWIYEKSLERAKEYGIKGVTYRLSQGVVKHIIPAVASTNAVIAGKECFFIKDLLFPTYFEDIFHFSLLRLRNI